MTYQNLQTTKREAAIVVSFYLILLREWPRPLRIGRECIVLCHVYRNCLYDVTFYFAENDSEPNS